MPSAVVVLPARRHPASAASAVESGTHESVLHVDANEVDMLGIRDVEDRAVFCRRLEFEAVVGSGI